MTEQQKAEMQEVADAFGWATVGCEHCFCHKLMEWLEGKGYCFERSYWSKTWEWRANTAEPSMHGGSQWKALYAAWKHWQEQQKPKGETEPKKKQTLY